MSPTWLSALVRARQVQEDTARARLADARHRATAARDTAVRHDVYVDGLCGHLADETTASAFVAAAAALQSAAAARSAAVFAAGQAVLTADARAGELRTAATARGAAEKLHERVDAVTRARLARAEQAQLDEIAARLHRDRAGDRA